MPEPGPGRPACYRRPHHVMTNVSCSAVVSAASKGGGVGRLGNRPAANGEPRGGICLQRCYCRRPIESLAPSPLF